MVKKLGISALASSALLTLFIGCGSIDNDGNNIIGDNLVMRADTMTPVINLPKVALGAGANLGIKSYKINYKTTDEKGEEVIASGLITIPDISPEFMSAYKNNLLPGLPNPKKNDFSLSIVSDQHGTIFTNDEAPSKTTPATLAINNKLIIGYSAQALFMTVQPDYIGYGDSNTSHPFILEKSLANATVDMIKASISFANKAGLPINGQVFLAGYSEGGYATMAAAKDIQENHPEINLKAVAPMAGPYDLETMGVETLKSPIMVFPPFLAYLAHAYADNYDDININEIVNAPYASTLPTLFDNEHDKMEIYAALPNALDGNISKQATDFLFVPTFSDDLIANKDNKLRDKFIQNSVINWSPKMPMRLYHCTNDTIIPYAMSTLAEISFTEQGSTSVELKPIDTVEINASNPAQVHGDCAPEAYGQVIPWFVSIRAGGK